MIADSDLVAQVLAGNRQAFRTLIKRHERLVSHMIGHMVDRSEDREELCQDVFLKVYEKLGEFSFQSKLSTWIATIAYRHGINHLRKKKLITLDFSDQHQIERFIDTQDVAHEMEEQEQDDMVMRLIEKLPVQYKTIVTLYHVQHMSYPEIVEVTGMPEGTVKNYLFRARQLLKEKLKLYLGNEVYER